jgi:hypothetical protein
MGIGPKTVDRRDGYQANLDQPFFKRGFNAAACIGLWVSLELNLLCVGRGPTLRHADAQAFRRAPLAIDAGLRNRRH